MLLWTRELDFVKKIFAQKIGKMGKNRVFKNLLGWPALLETPGNSWKWIALLEKTLVVMLNVKCSR